MSVSVCVCVSVCFFFGVMATASNPLELIKTGESISTPSKSSIIRTVTEKQQQTQFSNTSARNKLNASENPAQAFTMFLSTPSASGIWTRSHRSSVSVDRSEDHKRKCAHCQPGK